MIVVHGCGVEWGEDDGVVWELYSKGETKVNICMGEIDLERLGYLLAR